MEMDSRRTTPASSLQMPIGYRFCPTDEEIIIHYLHPKVFSYPLPSPAILQYSHGHHLFLHHPSRLPGDPKEKRYFFCKTSYINNNLHASASNPPAAGYWKPITKKNNTTHKLILASGCNHPIGFKKSFVFYQFSNHRRSASRTPWILHQFRLLYPFPFKMEEWVVCSIHMKAKNQGHGGGKKHKKTHLNHHRNDEEEVRSEGSSITMDDDTNIGVGPPQPPSTSSSASGITSG